MIEMFLGLIYRIEITNIENLIVLTVCLAPKSKVTLAFREFMYD